MDRQQMIKELVDDVENWELTDLVEWAKERYRRYLMSLSDKEVEIEYSIIQSLEED